jgi:hypothetical protein
LPGKNVFLNYKIFWGKKKKQQNETKQQPNKHGKMRTERQENTVNMSAMREAFQWIA